MSIILKNVNYVYSPETVYQKDALNDINLEIKDGEFIGIIGHTGSGKSTLVQHLNGLMKANSGEIIVNGQNIYDPHYKQTRLRQEVGLVFQYPEHQLFEANVYKDIAFGPKNQGLSEEEIRGRVQEAIETVGLDETYYDKSPFELSGGQKRRVAIAGVLAMKPKVLILDEPTAGLDPQGRDDILDQIAKLHREKKITIILVSHSMEDVAKYVNRIIVMNRGSVQYDGTPEEVFKYYKQLETIGLSAPKVTYLMNELKEKGFQVSTDITTVDGAVEELLRVIGR